MPKTRKEIISGRTHPRLIEKLQEYAAKREINMSELVDEMAQEYAAMHKIYWRKEKGPPKRGA